MARGWESKSVEAQIELAEIAKDALQRDERTPAQIELLRKRESLLLSRTRILHELETSQNPRYQKILSAALTDLDVKLSNLS